MGNDSSATPQNNRADYTLQITNQERAELMVIFYCNGVEHDRVQMTAPSRPTALVLIAELRRLISDRLSRVLGKVYQ